MSKTFAWLEQEGVPYEFVNYKKQLPTPELLQFAIDNIGALQLVNKKGTTWRKLSEKEQTQANDVQTLIPLLIAQPSLIKRPLLVLADRVACGYDEGVLAGFCG